MEKSVIPIIMAGGMGKRMGSDLPKVLHKVNGIPMIVHILRNVEKLSKSVNVEKIIIVVGIFKEQIQKTIEDYIYTPKIAYVMQTPEPLGTGHAIQCCKPELESFPDANILILSGDVPLLSVETMYRVLLLKSDVKLITTTIEDPTGYGRIVLKDGKFSKIVEQKDCTIEECHITRVNCGIYSIKSSLLCKYIMELKNENKQKEYYLTDIVEIIKTNEYIEVDMLEIEPDKRKEIIGINTIQQLKDLEELIQLQDLTK
jgi:UDP-N-acetylglucosamine diphosphorylase/glucosamine-1-phosphate N-acetyltransferase